MIKRKSKENKWFYFFNTLILVLFSLLIIVPIWNILVSSVSSSSGLAGKGLVLWPKGFTLENYRKVFSDSSIPRAFLISVLKTVIGASTHTLFCAIVAYGLSKSRLVGRNIYTTMGVITMYFGGGMIPTYLLIKSLGLLDTFWVYIIPALFSYYDVVILMNFFREIPPSLEDLMVMGNTIEDILLAQNELLAMQGGYLVASDQQVMATCPLPIGGILSQAPIEQLGAALQKVRQAMQALGYQNMNEIMSFSTLSLPVSPAIKVTDFGMMDTKSQRFYPLVFPEDGVLLHENTH
ncbi:adenine deaminase C-terminal domain-containing protein [Enterococcus faecalis]|uniref:adenine deaminase C-terminal domain-containing protein n=1 Tax=Enterococcus faecalis TaxID=1351 RepID=UPI003AF68388